MLVLIESLNEDGYLADPLEEIAERLAEVLGVEGDEEREELLHRLQCGLNFLQSMEPTGVGARSLGECLCLQLRQKPPPKSTAGHAAGRAEDLHRAPGAAGAARLQEDRAADRDGRGHRARGAGPDRGAGAQAGPPVRARRGQIIIPDVIVMKVARQWKAVLNPDVMPKLRVNDLYAQAIKSQRASGSALTAPRLQEARWFIRNIQQRFDTILRVSQAIIERQKNFFSHGAIAMKPLVLREIADELGLHESTISRVTTAKYMSTPFGTYELKYFFGSSLNTDAGGNASSTAVRALIKQLVAAESPAKPLSDSQLAELLEGQGIQVARRTVAKYREALKIAPANLRRTV